MEAGPTRSGHRTPAVIVASRSTAAARRSSAPTRGWSPGARRPACTGFSCATPSRPGGPGFRGSRALSAPHPGVGPGLGVGRRGSGGQAHAAEMWGLDVAEYMAKRGRVAAQPRRGAAARPQDRERSRARQRRGERGGAWHLLRRVGPGRHGAFDGASDTPRSAVSARHARGPARVLAACRAAGIAFLDQVTPRNVAERIAEGVRIGAGGRRARPRRSAAATRAAPYPGSRGPRRVPTSGSTTPPRRFGIEVVVTNRTWGRLFGYRGWFTAEWPRCSRGIRFPRHVRPVREERRE